MKKLSLAVVFSCLLTVTVFVQSSEAEAFVKELKNDPAKMSQYINWMVKNIKTTVKRVSFFRFLQKNNVDYVVDLLENRGINTASNGSDSNNPPSGSFSNETVVFWRRSEETGAETTLLLVATQNVRKPIKSSL